MGLDDDFCRIKQKQANPKEVQEHPCLDPKKDPCTPSHNEFICHLMGEKRQQYLKDVKNILDKMNTDDCPTKYDVMELSGSGGKGEYDRPMIKYPGYLDIDSPKYKKPFYEPMIVNVPTKEIRPTSEIWKHYGENSPTLEYMAVEQDPCKPWALPRKKSFELRGGILFKGCDCNKHNGLQDQCERAECNGQPECLTQPMATCPPSETVGMPPKQRPVEDMIREIVDHNSANKGSPTYCCCPTPGPQYKNICGKKYPDCNSAPGPGKMECYKCNH